MIQCVALIILRCPNYRLIWQNKIIKTVLLLGGRDAKSAENQLWGLGVYSQKNLKK